MSLAMAKGMLPLGMKGMKHLPWWKMWRRCPQLHWFRNSLPSLRWHQCSVCGSQTPFYSHLWEATWRGLQGIFSPKERPEHGPILEGWEFSETSHPAKDSKHETHPSLGFACPAADRGCTRVLESTVRLNSGTFPFLRAPLHSENSSHCRLTKEAIKDHHEHSEKPQHKASALK